MNKLCECGCGQPTKIIAHTDKKRGRLKGEYHRFIFGHRLKTLKLCSIKDCNKEYLAKGLCEKHYMELYHKQHYQDNKGKFAKYQKQWQQNNKERQAKHQKQYYLDNREHIANVSKQWKQDNKKRIAEVNKQWRENNSKYMNQYYQTPAGKAAEKARSHNRRVLTKDLTKEIVQRVYEDNIKKYGTLTCYLCFKPIEFGDDSLEHSIPLSRGGSNNYDNLGVAHFNCNCKKHAMTLEEWFEKRITN